VDVDPSQVAPAEAAKRLRSARSRPIRLPESLTTYRRAENQRSENPLLAPGTEFWYGINLSPAQNAVEYGKFVSRLKVRRCTAKHDGMSAYVRGDPASPGTF
jgi:hypothetical protein